MRVRRPASKRDISPSNLLPRQHPLFPIPRRPQALSPHNLLFLLPSELILPPHPALLLRSGHPHLLRLLALVLSSASQLPSIQFSSQMNSSTSIPARALERPSNFCSTRPRLTRATRRMPVLTSSARISCSCGARVYTQIYAYR